MRFCEGHYWNPDHRCPERYEMYCADCHRNRSQTRITWAFVLTLTVIAAAIWLFA